MTSLPISTAPLWQARSAYTVASSAASIGLVIASAGFGAVYAFKTGSVHGYILGALTVLFALALEIAKPLAVQGFFSAVRAWAFGQALCLALLAMLAIAYSLTAELSLMASIRSDTIATRQAQTKAAKQHDRQVAARDAERKRIEAELATIGEARPVAELEGIVAATRPRRRILVVNGRRETQYYHPAKLMAELGRAKRRAELEKALERFTPSRAEALAGSSPSAPAPVSVKDDPAAEALATYLALIGLHVPAATITEWLILVPVLALEVGSALAAVLVRNAGRNTYRHAPETQKRASVPSETQSVPESVPSAHSRAFPASHPRSMRQQHKPSEPLDQRLLRIVMERGGTLIAGQREIARLIGVSSSHAHRLLHDLSGAGLVSLTPGRTGTVVKRVMN